MKNAGLLSSAVGAAYVVLSLPALAQSGLPEGPNRDLVARECSLCHDVELVMSQSGNTLEQWVSVLEQMQGNGLQVSSADRVKIIEYLANYLGPGSAATERKDRELVPARRAVTP